ncbi:hypothetical protein A2U01_0039458 [Trifolium medium]|uniref:Uncharacterized protein n=1 Tax=Trifolium medium TaxID=97028 RepID=A0A392Q2G5_9FABA|nr:hypothetical protein [Trifolium medium]MCI18304.1 hypothetical protein [Trifolium medium]
MRKQEGLESFQFASQSPAQQQQYGAETQVLNSNVLCPINYGSLARSPLHGNGLEDTAIEIMKSYIRGGHPIEDCAFLWNATTALTGGQASGCVPIICL